MERGIARAGDLTRRMYLVRGHRVMLDADLARLYEVETKALNRALKRNATRFPPDFAFRLTAEEARSLRCQIGTSNEGRGGRRYLPWAFTEHGVAMLSGVLASRRAIQVNIAVVRAFVRLRQMLSVNTALADKLAELERRMETHDRGIRSLFQAMKGLMASPARPRRRIGFRPRP